MCISYANSIHIKCKFLIFSFHTMELIEFTQRCGIYCALLPIFMVVTPVKMFQIALRSSFPISVQYVSKI